MIGLGSDKNRVCWRFLLGAQEWGLLKDKELSAGSIFTYPLQSGSMREAIWMWQEKKLIMCVSREKGGEGKKRDTEGLAAFSNSDQYQPTAQCKVVHFHHVVHLPSSFVVHTQSRRI